MKVEGKRFSLVSVSALLNTTVEFELKALMNLHSQNSFEMNVIIIIWLFIWEWKYSKIEGKSNYEWSILDSFDLSSVCQKYLALHSNLYM